MNRLRYTVHILKLFLFFLICSQSCYLQSTWLFVTGPLRSNLDGCTSQKKSSALPYRSTLFSLFSSWPPSHSEITGWSFCQILSLPSLAASSLFQLQFQKCLNTLLRYILLTLGNSVLKLVFLYCQWTDIGQYWLPRDSSLLFSVPLLQIWRCPVSPEDRATLFRRVMVPDPWPHTSLFILPITCTSEGQRLSEGKAKCSASVSSLCTRCPAMNCFLVESRTHVPLCSSLYFAFTE